MVCLRNQAWGSGFLHNCWNSLFLACITLYTLNKLLPAVLVSVKQWEPQWSHSRWIITVTEHVEWILFCVVYSYRLCHVTSLKGHCMELFVVQSSGGCGALALWPSHGEECLLESVNVATAQSWRWQKSASELVPARWLDASKTTLSQLLLAGPHCAHDTHQDGWI